MDKGENGKKAEQISNISEFDYYLNNKTVISNKTYKQGCNVRNQVQTLKE